MTHPARRGNHGYLEGVGRLRLHYRTWEVAAPRAALIVVHGLFEHGGRYADFGDTLAAADISTFALDLRGHGESAGRRGHVPRFEILLQDVERFRREVQGLVDVDTPIFVLGHSFGGLIVTRYLEEYDAPCAGAILTSPWMGLAQEPPRWKVLMGQVLNRVLPAFPFSGGIDPSQLSHDEERVRDYVEDPLIHDRVTPRLFSEVSAAIDLAQRRGDRIRVPLLFLIAGADPVVDSEKALAFARSLPPDHVSVEVLEGHFHEVLQEVNRAAVYRMVRDWIHDHGALPAR